MLRHQFSFLGIAALRRNTLYKNTFRSEKKQDYRLEFCLDACWEKSLRISVCGCKLFENNAVLS